jgi:small subunit ribosomal protein S6
MNRTYELIYVLKPDAAESEVADMHKQVADIVDRLGGTIDKTENGMPWGRRKLAYEIGHHKEGFYVRGRRG